jgi:hypothetical protein
MSLLGRILGSEEAAQRLVRKTGAWPYLERFTHWLNRIVGGGK